MPLEREDRVVPDHTGAVIQHPHQPAPAQLDLDPDPSRTGIYSVLDKLLYDGSRPLDHLARGDLVRKVVGEYADLAHHK